MRVWGRRYNAQKTAYEWVQVNTDANGFNDAVYVTALAQVLQLNTGESPFWANYGIPAIRSITLQLFPDLAVYFIQQQYAKYFASLKIGKIEAVNEYNVQTPVYQVNIITQSGSIINFNVPIPI
jgi:hypothetical protein